MCTLLLSALAPSVPALRDLTIQRLGALNHGSVITPIKGAEVGVIKGKVDEWAARFAEIKAVGTDANLGVRLEPRRCRRRLDHHQCERPQQPLESPLVRTPSAVRGTRSRIARPARRGRGQVRVARHEPGRRGRVRQCRGPR
ncbi:hypothetical protein ACU686_29625 [Yinghuangia aomiensis]